MRHQDIVSLVRDVMRACDLPETARNPRTVAKRLGILVVDWLFPDNVSSLLVRPTVHGAVIYLNCRHQLTRQNWHLAHELGHYILHPVGVYASTHEPGRLERKANVAAAEILMPAEAVRGVVARKGPDVPVLARLFGVSREGLRLRLGELGIPVREGGTMDAVRHMYGSGADRDRHDLGMRAGGDPGAG